jgi:ABC-2 type transport system permease protein
MNIMKYYHIGRINFINSFVYFGDIVASSFFVGLIVFVFTQLWQVIYSGNELIAGFTIVMMIWYFVMTESIVTSLPSVIEKVGEEIRSGEVANYLNKPYSYIFYNYSVSLGSAIFKFLLTLSIGSIVAFLVIGKMDFNFLYIPLLFIIIILAITIHFILMMFIGVFAFWFEDSRSLYLIYQKIVFTIGGMLLPLEIFPNWLASISKFLPFSYIAYYPAKLFVEFNINFFFEILIKQLLWIILFFILTFLIYKIGERRLSINGG